MQNKKIKSISGSIPGGLCGYNPGSFPKKPLEGIIIVDPAYVVNAIVWLMKKATIKKLCIALISINGESVAGLKLCYRLKKRGR